MRISSERAALLATDVSRLDLTRSVATIMNVLGGRRRAPQHPTAQRIPLSVPRGGRPPRHLAWIPAIALSLLGCSVSAPDLPVTQVNLPTVKQARSLLAALPLHRSDYYQAPYPYSRLAFGQEWFDVDGNGRGTRDDVLAAQLTDIQLDGNGNVASGSFTDPYTGLRVDYVRGRTETDPVVVDHVVSLWEAWATGAWAWTAEERVAYANDPLNLVATTYKINDDKAAQNVARWHPTAPAQESEFALRVIATKAKYTLEIHSKDRAYLEGVLNRC